MNKRILLVAIMTFSFICGIAQKMEQIELYPQGAPDSNGLIGDEYRQGECCFNISEASMCVYHPIGNTTDAVMLICPGGGYICEADDHEGHQVAKWLSEQGLTAIVLKYRLPNYTHKEIPLNDVRTAVQIIRKNAKKWNINPQKIGISGFSAGGHLASTAATHLAGTPDAFNYAVLFYPVITMDTRYTHEGSLQCLLGKNPSKEDIHNYSNENRVTHTTPPTLLFLSDDDGLVPPMNSIQFYTALKANNVPAAMYIFPCFGHGWGFRPSFPYHETWKKLMLDWMKEIKML